MQTKFVLAVFVLMALGQPAIAQVEADQGSFHPRLAIGVGAGAGVANGICIPCDEEERIVGYTFLASAGIMISKKAIVETVVTSWVSIPGE